MWQKGWMRMNPWIADFPILAADENGNRLVYLDSAATTQHPTQVLDAVADYYRRDNANPHRGVYELAMRATDAHENARHTVAKFFNAQDDEIVFTQNTTESLNLVAYSYGLHFLHAGDEIALSVAEHHSNLVPWQRVAAATGAKLVYLYPDEGGHLTEQELDKKITGRTKLVAVAMVSNVLGLRAPVESIVRRAHAVGAVVVLDCAQSAPHVPVDVKALDVDFAACSAHKLYAPMGVGALYAKRALLDKMPPFLSGGDMIAAVHEQTATYAEGPRKFEAGTRNVGGEVGFAAALDYMTAIGWQTLQQHEHALLKQMLDGMRAMPWPSTASRRRMIAAAWSASMCRTYTPTMSPPFWMPAAWRCARGITAPSRLWNTSASAAAAAPALPCTTPRRTSTPCCKIWKTSER